MTRLAVKRYLITSILVLAQFIIFFLAESAILPEGIFNCLTIYKGPVIYCNELLFKNYPVDGIFVGIVGVLWFFVSFKTIQNGYSWIREANQQ